MIESMTVSVPATLFTQMAPPTFPPVLLAPVSVKPSRVTVPVLTPKINASAAGASMVVTDGPPVDTKLTF